MATSNSLNRSIYAAGFCAAVLLLCVAPANAQTRMAENSDASGNAASDEGQIETVVVTARLRKETAAQTPAVIMAISGDKLEQNGITNMNDIGQIAPDVDVSSGFLLDAIHIRGVGTATTDTGFEQQVGLYVDGVYYGSGHWVNGAYIDLDSIEVLKGPQGVYLGQNSIGGALNIATKNPGDAFESYVTAGYEAIAAERYVEGVVSGPLSDTLGARLAIHATQMDGWATQYVTGQEAPAARDIVGRLTLDYKPTDNFDANLKVTIDSYHDNGTSSYDNLLYCGGPGNTPAPLSLFWPQESAPCVRGFKDANAITGLVGYPNTHTEPSYTAEQSYATALNMHWRQSFGELTSVTSWNSYVLDAFLYSGIGADVNGFGAIPGQNNNENKTYSQELRYQTKFDSPVNFLFGGYAQHASFDAFESFALAPMAIMQAPWSTVHNEGVNSDSLAFFGEAQWAILSNLSFDASARWTQVRKMFHWNNTACGGFFCPAFPVYGIQGDRTFDNVSPQATLTWQATDDVMAYAAYKTGFLAGGYSETGTMGPNETAANFNFGNESAKGGEVGSKFFLANRSLYFDASAFYYQYTGLQVSTYDPATTAFAVQNAGKSINEGVELNGQWNTGTGFKFSGNVVYLNSYYAQFVGSCLYGASSPATYFACNVLTPAGTYEQNFKGTPTDFAPKWAGRVAVDYDTNVGDYLIHAGTGLGFTSSYSESQIPIEPGYVKVDAQLSVDKGPWSAAFKGLNLNNVADCSQVAGRPLSTADFPNARIGGEIDCVLERGRQLRFEITRRF